MGSKTGIEWTDATWNPILGCSRVSEGCRNCYAEAIAGRFGGGKETVYSGLTQIVNGRAVWTGEIKETKQLLQPLSWRSPKRVFVNSMSDLFHENVSDELRDRIFAVMALCPQHTFQVLTKRPERMLEYCYRLGTRADSVSLAITRTEYWDSAQASPCAVGAIEDKIDAGPLPNVWLGVSVEHQAAADERIPLLLKTPAAVRFISAEPLLGAVRLDRICEEVEGHLNALAAVVHCDGRGTKEITGIDWVICGGESGPGARPMHPDWARSLRDQCAAASVPFFFKQWGEWTPGENVDRICGKVTIATYSSGQWFYADENLANDEGHRDDEPDVYRIGKKSTGALLDGVEHKQFPEVRQ